MTYYYYPNVSALDYAKEIKHLYQCFIAVIKYGYEFGCI